MRTFIIASLLVLSVKLSFSQAYVNASGLVSIGTTTPNGPFLVHAVHSKYTWPGASLLQLGQHAADPRIQSVNKIVFYNVTNSGYIDVEVRNLYQFSDRSAKDNIQTISSKGSSLQKIKELNGVSFQWKEGSDKSEHTGFIAQDVEKIFPNLVSTADSSGMKILSYSGLIPYLVEAVKEQQVTIEKLQEIVNKQASASTPKNPINSNPPNNELLANILGEAKMEDK